LPKTGLSVVWTFNPLEVNIHVPVKSVKYYGTKEVFQDLMKIVFTKEIEQIGLYFLPRIASKMGLTFTASRG
jgi:hypothetical protein